MLTASLDVAVNTCSLAPDSGNTATPLLGNTPNDTGAAPESGNIHNSKERSAGRSTERTAVTRNSPSAGNAFTSQMGAVASATTAVCALSTACLSTCTCTWTSGSRTASKVPRTTASTATLAATPCQKRCETGPGGGVTALEGATLDSMFCQTLAEG